MLTKEDILGPAWHQAVVSGDHGKANAIECARKCAPPVRVLALDGGGMRGLYQARVLFYLREGLRSKLNSQNLELCDVFDIVLGTSTGGILASGLLTQHGMLAADRDRLAAMESFYRDLGPQIFRRVPVWNHARWLLRSRYSAKALEGHLRDQLGESSLSAVDRRLLLSSYNPATNRTHWFDSHTPNAWVPRGAEPSPDPLLWHVARATSAAPTYFPSARFDDLGHSQGWVDGGVGANNPVLKAVEVGLIEFRKRREGIPGGCRTAAADQHDKVIVVSIGNGEAVPRLPTGWSQGLARWTTSAPKLLMHAAGTIAADIAESLPRGLVEPTINDEFRPVISILRIEPSTESQASKLDDFSDTALDALSEQATNDCCTPRRGAKFRTAVLALARASSPV